MSERFTPLEVFFSFKHETIKDEDRKGAVNDITLQLKMVHERLGKLDNSRHTMAED